MIESSFIRQLVETHLQETGLFLVDVLVKQSNVITVIIDGNEAVTIDDCVRISRLIESSLDRDEEDFELKVMSAGADAPFQDERQYRKNIGKKVKIITNEGIKYQGVLTAFDGINVNLELLPKTKKGQKPGKNYIPEQCSIPLSEIKETKKIIIWTAEI
jgi:ribosome maturation factor RimP